MSLKSPKMHPHDSDVPSSPDIVLNEDILEAAQEEEANDDVDTSIEKILAASEKSLPKDAGEINVSGHLRFDQEMPPDQETKNNTIHNALLYQLRDDDDENDHIHHKVHGKDTDKKKVLSFDTYTPHIDVTHYQTTMVHQDKHFDFNNHSRTFMVPYDAQKPSIDAIHWTMGDMIDDHDILVVIKVVSLQYIMKHGVQLHREHCKELFRNICHENKLKKKLKIIVEVRIGSVDYAIARAFREFDPNFLVMGTKGIKKTKLTNFLSEDTSLTKHFLNNGRIPVVVVNPLYEETEYACLPSDVNTKYFVNYLTSYPSVYDPLVGVQTLEMERSASGDVSIANGGGNGAGRTSRFLRISKSISRSSSVNSGSTNASGSMLSPSTSHDLSPVTSAGRTLSPRRTLSPFRLFHRK